MYLQFQRLIFILIILLISSCNNQGSKEVRQLTLSEKIDSLSCLHDSLGTPKVGDWLAYKKEKGQSFKQYTNSSPVYPTPPIDKIYIQAIGEFDNSDSIVISKTHQFIEAFFGLEVILLDSYPVSEIPKKNKRFNNNTLQIQTKFVLDSLLIPNLPNDCIVFTAFTSEDLYPNDDWNFVFGQAYLKHRASVSSMYRFKKNSSNSSIYLKRFIRTATHEICHTFSLKHCTTYRCLMNGSNSLMEADKKPIYLCPECLKKILWCTNMDIIERYNNILNFCIANGLNNEVKYYKEAISIINTL